MIFFVLVVYKFDIWEYNGDPFGSLIFRNWWKMPDPSEILSYEEWFWNIVQEKKNTKF